MTAKHDGKHARANIWVMQQNLAKQKGGRPGYMFQERKRPANAAAALATKNANASTKELTGPVAPGEPNSPKEEPLVATPTADARTLPSDGSLCEAAPTTE